MVLSEFIVSSDHTQNMILDKIRQEAVFMAQDLFSALGVKHPPKSPNEYCEVLRRSVNALPNPPDLDKWVLDENVEYRVFETVGDGLCTDGEGSWERIVRLHQFAAQWANYLSDSVDPVTSSSNLVVASPKDEIAKFTGRYIADRFGKWILGNGGWDVLAERGKICLEAIVMANDLVSTFGVGNPPKAPNRHCEILRITVKELTEMHYLAFKNIRDRLKRRGKVTYCEFSKSCDEVFIDGVNWGRIVAVYALAAHWATCLADSVDPGSNPELPIEHAKERIANFVGYYVGSVLGEWILTNGGWGAFAKYRPDRGELETKALKAMLFTTLGFGVLSTLLFAIR